MPRPDLVIRGATVADGDGGPLYEADVSIVGDRIWQVGKVREAGREEIDAHGLLVTPGWVDIHTHYDGQVTWDSHVTPSSIHGTTTVLMGNCGVGFAPVRPADRARLIRLMEGVEDIPGAALHAGLDWSWRSFGEYLDAIDARPHDINIATQIPHGAVRLFVMGERGARREPASTQDITDMRAIVRDGIRCGALGFSTTRTMVHLTADGEPTPTLGAADAEMLAIADGLREAGAGVIQWVSDFADLDHEFGLLEQLIETSGRPLSFSLVESERAPDQWRTLLGRLEAAAGRGLPIKGQVQGRPVGLMIGLQGSVHPYMGRPAYEAIGERPLAERVAIMRRPEVRAALLGEASRGDTFFASAIAGAYHRMFELGDPPNYEPAPSDSVGARAGREGCDPEDLVFDLLTADQGRGFLFFPLLNYGDFDLENARSMMLSPHTVFGLSDGGAHVGAICDVSVPTFMLTHWCRDRTRGARLDPGFVVRSQTRDTAEAVGLLDRGRLARGYRADLNIIDYERLRLRPPHMVYDLPAEARRLMQEADGYVATIVGGEVIYREGQATGALPGQLIRGRQPRPWP